MMLTTHHRFSLYKVASHTSHIPGVNVRQRQWMSTRRSFATLTGTLPLVVGPQAAFLHKDCKASFINDSISFLHCKPLILLYEHRPVQHEIFLCQIGNSKSHVLVVVKLEENCL